MRLSDTRVWMTLISWNESYKFRRYNFTTSFLMPCWLQKSDSCLWSLQSLHPDRSVSAVSVPPRVQTGRSEDLCLLAVPNHMTGSDLCNFTGSFLANIRAIRIVRSAHGLSGGNQGDKNGSRRTRSFLSEHCSKIGSTTESPNSVPDEGTTPWRSGTWCS